MTLAQHVCWGGSAGFQGKKLQVPVLDTLRLFGHHDSSQKRLMAQVEEEEIFIPELISKGVSFLRSMLHEVRAVRS